MLFRSFNAGRTSNQVQSHTFQGNPNGETQTFTIQINNDSSGSYFDNDGSFNTTTYSHEPTYSGSNNYFATLTSSVDISVYGSFSPNTITVYSIISLVQNNIILNSQQFFVGSQSVPDDGNPYSYTFTSNLSVSSENTGGTGTYVRVSTYVDAEGFSISSSQTTISNISFKNSVANKIGRAHV